MSYTTRCPACGTMFKVVPDQLKISDGWVRCGHCADVFDATLYLEGEAAPATVPKPPEQEAPSVVPQPAPVASTRTFDEEDGDWLLEPSPGSDPAEAWTTAEFQALDSAFEGNAATDTSAWLAVSKVVEARGEPLAPASTHGLKTSPEFADELKQFAVGVSKAPPEPEGLASLPAATLTTSEKVDPGLASNLPSQVMPDEALSPSDAEPGFVRQARRKAFWRSPLMRAVLVSVSVVLVMLLFAQWAVQDRDRLAAQYPASLPLLNTLCRPLACQVGPVRQIEAVVIDSSNLVRRLGNFYAFDLVLKNSAPVAVAVPALELSLTDSRDAVISRRVFLPEELPGAPVLLPPQGALSMSLRLSIADSGVSSMTGYRALVFYP